MAKCPADFDFFSSEVIESPFEFYEAVRRDAPVYQLPGTEIFMLSRWEDIRRVNRDTKTLSNNFQELLKGPEPCAEAAAIYSDGYAQPPTLLTLDPPEHKVFRSLISWVCPRDDMISDLANNTIKHADGERLMTVEELLSMIEQLLVAGNETTTSAITGGLLSLVQLSDQLQVLLDDPGMIGNAVEEILRLESPSAGLWRGLQELHVTFDRLDPDQ